MADEKLWGDYTDQPVLNDTDILLVSTSVGAGVNVPGSAILKRALNGNFGVGITTPLSALHVEGVHATSIIRVSAVVTNPDFSPTIQLLASLPGIAFGGGALTHNLSASLNTPIKATMGTSAMHLSLAGDIDLRTSAAGAGDPVTRLLIESGGAAIRPGTANLTNLGGASFAFKGGFIQNAFTITSDATKKKQLSGLNDAQIRAGKRIIAECCWWQWLESIAQKGADGARWHFGPMAQDVARILIEEGVEADYQKGNPTFRSDFLGWDEWAAVTQPIFAIVKTKQIDRQERQVADGEEIIEQKFLLMIDGKQVEAIHRVTVPTYKTEMVEVESQVEEQIDTGQVKVIDPAGCGFCIDPSQLAFFLLACLNADTERRLAAIEAAKVN